MSLHYSPKNYLLPPFTSGIIFRMITAPLKTGMFILLSLQSCCYYHCPFNVKYIHNLYRLSGNMEKCRPLT